MVVRLTLLFICIAMPAARAMRPDSGLCRAAIAMTERTTGVPDRLMQAVSVIESGRRDADGTAWPWPWTINVEGVGEIYESKREVIAAVQRHQAEGARSIDVGCMQVNIKHHPDAFSSLEEAFDPAANARYAAHFLQQLLVQTGSWPRAVAGYHSLTPDVGAEYARKVLAVWARPEPHSGAASPVAASQLAPPLPAPPLFAPSQATATSSPAAPSPAGSLAGTASARVLAMPGAAMPAMTGRTLASYRLLPTRPVAMMLLRTP